MRVGRRFCWATGAFPAVVSKERTAETVAGPTMASAAREAPLAILPSAQASRTVRIILTRAWCRARMEPVMTTVTNSPSRWLKRMLRGHRRHRQHGVMELVECSSGLASLSAHALRFSSRRHPVTSATGKRPSAGNRPQNRGAGLLGVRRKLVM